MTLATSVDLRPVLSTGKMWTGMAASGVLHVAVAVFLVAGLPQLFKPEPAQLTVPVDIVNLDELSELASLPAEQVGPVETAEQSRPVDEVDEVARPQQATPQAAPAVQPTPPQPEAAPETAPQPEPAVQPETAAAPPAPAAADAPPAEASAQPRAVPEAEPAPTPAIEAAPELSAVAPEPQAPRPSPEPQAAAEPEPARPVETPTETAEAVEQPAEPSEDQPLMAGVLPVPSPPRPEDAPPPEPQAEAAAPTPPPSPVRAEEAPKEEPVDDLLAGVLKNVDKNLKPAVREQQQEAMRQTGSVTQSPDITRRAAALGQMIRGQMQRCWRIDPGARSAERLRVSVRVRLKPNGTLAAPPEFQNVGELANNAYYRAAAESARRAILECQPFRLPQDDYALWQDLVLNFDPREMF